MKNYAWRITVDHTTDRGTVRNKVGVKVIQGLAGIFDDAQCCLFELIGPTGVLLYSGVAVGTLVGPEPLDEFGRESGLRPDPLLRQPRRVESLV